MILQISNAELKSHNMNDIIEHIDEEIQQRTVNLL